MQTLPKSLHIGVIRGGPSAEYDVSLQSGAHVLEHFGSSHKPIDILITKDGKWHMNGIERAPERVFKHVDVIFNALHGEYGEDGKIQDLLDRHGVIYTGSLKYPSALSMNKVVTKEHVKALGVKTPLYVAIRRSDKIVEKAKEATSTIPYPLIVKPANSGSSLGLHRANSFSQLLTALENVLSEYDTALVEECIVGREASCGVIDDFRKQDIYSLPVVEIIPPVGKQFDYDSKYSGESQEIVPSTFSDIDKKELERLSALIHKGLGLRHYSRSDFIVSPRRGIYFLEVNTLPGMTKKSIFPKSLEAVGIKMKDFLHHVVGLALAKK
jgi:D-alanine-D-alanine ligase